MRQLTAAALARGCAAVLGALMVSALNFSLLSSHFLLAQDQSQRQQPVFRAGVEYVTVDVVVTDRDDRPITDLTVDDFELFEEGRPQTIADFAFMYTPVMTREIETVPVDAPPADVVTNTPPPRGSRLFAVVIDELHLIETDIVPLEGLLKDFLRAIAPEDQVAIVYTGRSDLAQDFTSDLGLLLRAVDGLTEAVGFGHDARPVVEIQDYLHQARSTTFVLRNVARALVAEGHPRRAIVLVSGGLSIDPSIPPCRGVGGVGSSGASFRTPFQRQRCSNEENRWAQTLRADLEGLYREAARSNVPVYTLDPRGLATPENAVRGYRPVLDDDLEIRRRIRIQQDFMAEVAVNTGGRAFANRSNLTDAVNEVVADNGSYYLLGYYPEPFPADGEFHEVDVRVRRPGVRVRARKGYVATDPASRPAPGRPSLDAVLGNIRPAGDIALRAFAAPLSRVDDGTRTAVIVEAAYPPAEGPGDIEDELLLSILAVDPDGRMRAESHRRVNMTVPAAAAGQPRFVALGDLIAIPDGRVTLRIGVASRSLEETATVHLPLDVPDLTEGDLQMGGLVLASDSRRPPPIASPPGLQTVLPFQPTLSREFAKAETLRLFVRLRWDIDEGEPAASVALRGEATVITRDAAIVPVAADGNEREGAVDTTIALADVPPGPYVLELTATLPNGDSVSRRVALEVRQ
jgi:VWFA-related protein